MREACALRDMIFIQQELLCNMCLVVIDRLSHTVGFCKDWTN